MATKIQIRRDSSSNWSTNNPTLSSGEIGFVTDENKIKIGDGSTAWNSLSYLEADAYLDSVVMGDDTTGNYVETLIASDGISISGEGAESASVTITNTGVLSLAGTTNEIEVSASSGNINLSLPTSITVDLVGDVTGNADTASTLATARNISLGGDVSGSASFDGSADITITATVADDSHNHIIANVDGLQTAIDTAESDAVSTANSYADSLASNYDAAGSASAVASDLTDHENATTNVHGIADTSALATKTYADNAGVTSLTGTASEIDVSASSGAVTLSLPATINADTTGNAATASTLETARSISLDGDVSGSASFNGGSNITITATVADDSHNHTVSNVDGLQSALDAKAPLESPALTGTPTAPTASSATNSTQIATTAFVQTAVGNLIDGAPGALDTLNELAASLGDDSDFAGTVTNSLAGKQPLDSDLTAIAGLSASATGYAKKTGDGTWSVGDVALGTDTSGNYVASISGTTNEIEVTGSGSESAAVTIGLPETINANTTGSAAKLTTPRTIALSGDVTGSANFDGSASVSITATVEDDSHNHVISNVDGLQTALDSKLNSESYTAADVLSKIKTVDGSTSGLDSDLLDGQEGSYYLDWTNTTNKPDPTITLTGDVSGSATLTDLNSASVTVSIEPNSVELGTDTSGIYVARISTSGDGLSATGSGESASVTLTNTGVTSLSGTASEIEVSASTGSVTLSLPSTINANTTGNAATSTKLATERAIALSGDVSGSANFDGSASISITATVADDSHNHIIENVDGLQSALDAKLDSTSYTASDVLTKIKTVDGASSGLDADLLDGQDGSHYLDWNNTTNKPDPTITLGGDASGSLTMTDLAGGTLTVTVSDDSHNHIISNVDGLQTALDAKAPLDSPALTGTPTAPTASASANSTQIATTAFVQTNISNLINGAPGALDTLDELAAALGDDANFASTVTNSLAGKQPLDADLTAIAGLSASATGILTKDGDNQWSLDTNSYITGNQTITLSGDVSGSGTTSIEVTIADDSHNHIISNVDGLQDALDLKLNSSEYTASDVLTKIKTVDGSTSGLDSDLLDGQDGSYYLDWTNTTNKPDPTITLGGDASGSLTLTDLAGGTLTLTLENSGVSASTYGGSTSVPVITVDSKGRLTGVTTSAIASLPSQTGNDGKYLTTDGTTASWSYVSSLNMDGGSPSSVYVQEAVINGGGVS